MRFQIVMLTISGSKGELTGDPLENYTNIDRIKLNIKVIITVSYVCIDH